LYFKLHLALTRRADDDRLIDEKGSSEVTFVVTLEVLFAEHIVRQGHEEVKDSYY